MTTGTTVQVTSLVGTEVGVLESINYKTGKALVFFAYADCPHFCSFNISQLKAVA
jgi:cytochrome oxidase Cu insertion factor (SCO1/SenC/PrrC family)